MSSEIMPFHIMELTEIMTVRFIEGGAKAEIIARRIDGKELHLRVPSGAPLVKLRDETNEMLHQF